MVGQLEWVTEALNEEQLQSVQEKSSWSIQASIEAFRKAQLDCLALESDIRKTIFVY